MPPKQRELFAFKSCGVFPLTWRPRKVLLHVVNHAIFSSVFNLLIVANAVLLALYNPLSSAPEEENAFLDNSEIFFLVAFSLGS
jgi:hypothetical protein